MYMEFQHFCHSQAINTVLAKRRIVECGYTCHAIRFPILSLFFSVLFFKPSSPLIQTVHHTYFLASDSTHWAKFGDFCLHEERFVCCLSRRVTLLWN